MARYETRSWPADPSAPGGRAERRAFSYRAFVPDPIAGLELALPSNVAAAVSTAERAVDALNRDPPRLASLEVLARRLLRAESVASSRIEGLVLSQRRLARAEAEEPDARDETARSVLGNVVAMEHAVALGAGAKPLRLKDVLEIHRLLMLATTTPEIAGKLRERQNWIGGNAFNPGRADFVPPAPERVKGLMDDLVAFMNRTDLPPVVQAAIAHAQFETIHPFADGNGRVGRALIHVVLRRRGLAPALRPAREPRPGRRREGLRRRPDRLPGGPRRPSGSSCSPRRSSEPRRKPASSRYALPSFRNGGESVQVGRAATPAPRRSSSSCPLIPSSPSRPRRSSSAARSRP